MLHVAGKGPRTMKIILAIGIALLVIGSCAARPHTTAGVPTITRAARKPQIFTDAFIRAAIKYCNDQGKHIEGLVCHIPEGCAIVCKRGPTA